jgi:hypothetical protein
VRLKDLLEERKTDVAATAAEIEIKGLSADSRRVEPGYLFAALPGARADGRAYIIDALKRGASAILAPLDTELPPEIGRVPVILDDNPRRRLALMAARFYRKQPKTSRPSPAPAARPRPRISHASSGRSWVFVPAASARSASSPPAMTIPAP